jgi:phosphate transport system permease protein
VPGLADHRVTAVAAVGAERRLIGTSDGRVVTLEVKFAVEFKDGLRTVTPRPTFGEPSLLDPDRRRPIQRLVAAETGTGPLVVGQVGPTDLVVQSVVERKALIGASRKEELLAALPAQIDGEITALALDGRGEDLFLGTSRGQLVRYDLRDRATPARMESVALGTSGVPLTVLGFLNGDRTLVVGDERGAVSTWQVVPPPVGGAARLTRLYDFRPHQAAVVAMSPSRRDKGFATADALGQVHLHYGTSGQTLLTLAADRGRLAAVAIAPTADGVLAVDTAGAVSHWRLDNPHPEATLRTLFGKVWYEGYSEPAHAWQSTGGTDDFEA